MWSIHSTLCFPVGYLVVPKSFCNKLCFPHWFDGLPYNTVNFLVCWVSFGLVFCAVPPASQWAMVSVLFNNLSELLLRLTFPFQRFFFVIVVFVLVILPILPFLINTCLNLFYLEWFSSTTSVLSTAVNSLLERKLMIYKTVSRDQTRELSPHWRETSPVEGGCPSTSVSTSLLSASASLLLQTDSSVPPF